MKNLKLVEGVHRFKSEYFAPNRSLFEKLARHGQKPETLFITCADSRVMPNSITSTGPGELFTVRNVGNIVPSVEGGVIGGVAAAIQYAVEVLDVSSIIVCGHTDCGAIRAILDPESARHLEYVRRWLNEAALVPDLLAKRYSELTGRERQLAAVEENVLLQLEHLRTYDFVSNRLDEGKLTINGWVFDIEAGDVYGYDPESEQFVCT